MKIEGASHVITVDVDGEAVYPARGSYEMERQTRPLRPVSAEVKIYDDGRAAIAVYGHKIKKDGTDSQVMATIDYYPANSEDWPPFVTLALYEARRFIAAGDRYEAR